MSTAINKAIYARLTGLEILTGAGLQAQQDLAALLATDPDTLPPNPGPPLPAVFNCNKNDAPAVYPLVTFRPGAGMIDGHFEDGTMAVDHAYYDFEIWENTREGTVITDIADALERLLDQRRPGATPIALASGYLYWSETFVPIQVIYDDVLNAWFGLWRVRFIEARF